MHSNCFFSVARETFSNISPTWIRPKRGNRKKVLDFHFDFITHQMRISRPACSKESVKHIYWVFHTSASRLISRNITIKYTQGAHSPYREWWGLVFRLKVLRKFLSSFPQMCSSDQSGAASVRDPAASQLRGFKEFRLQRWILWSGNYSLEIVGKRGDPEEQHLSLQPTRPWKHKSILKALWNENLCRYVAASPSLITSTSDFNFTRNHKNLLTSAVQSNISRGRLLWVT